MNLSHLVPLALTLALLSHTQPSYAALCRDVLAGNQSSNSKILNEKYPEINVLRENDGYLVVSRNNDGSKNTKNFSTVSAMIASLTAAVSTGNESKSGANIHFQGFSESEANNITSSMSLRNQSVFYRDTDKPNINGDDLYSEDFERGPQRVEFKKTWMRLNEKRHNWNNAEISDYSEPIALKGKFDSEYRQEFVVSAERVDSASLPVWLNVLVYFKSKLSIPIAGFLYEKIYTALSGKEMANATVKKAARKLIDELEDEGKGIAAEVQVWDVTLTELVPISSNYLNKTIIK